MIDLINEVIGTIPDEFYIFTYVISAAFLYLFVINILNLIRAVIGRDI